MHPTPFLLPSAVMTLAYSRCGSQSSVCGVRLRGFATSAISNLFDLLLAVAGLGGAVRCDSEW